MSGQSSKWREDQILILCPGSRTTMAQLGCNELTPPAYRIPTRMFRDDDTDEWRPYRTWKRKKVGGSDDNEGVVAVTSGGKEEDEWEYVEDPDSDEGAVYPMEGGYITNMEAFLAFLEHVHGLLTTTYHNTPIMLMASPQWTRPDCEAVALYIFEKTRTPALCLINSALATQYGLKWPHMTVVDIGFEKVDVTCIYDSRIVNHMDVGYPAEPGEDRAISGGEVFTQRLMKLLRDKDFTYDMAEQLKKSPVCEVLPYAPDQPLLMELPREDATALAATAAATTASTSASAPAPAPAAPAAAADASGAEASSTSAQPSSSVSQPTAAAASSQQKPAPIAAADIEVEMDDGAENDGVLDVAQIVTSGQTREFLAKKEKEKSERGRPGRRGKDKEAEATAAKPVRLTNAKRARAVFHYEELVEDNEPEKPAAVQAAGNNSGADAAAGSAADGSGKAQGEDEKASKAVDPDANDKADMADKADKMAEAADGGAPQAIPDEANGAVAAKPEEGKETGETSGKTAAEEGAGAGGDDAKKEKAEEEQPAAAETEAAPAADAAAAAAATAIVPAATSTEAAIAAAAAAVEQQGRRFKRQRRAFDIGLERFTFADRVEIDRIVTTIYRTIQGIEDMYMRPMCWENLVFVGNGCRLRGLRDNIMQTLMSRHLISPSTATIFTSELPSHLGTPSGTGAQTPTSSFAGGPGAPAPSSVNPLLQAATMGSLAGGPGSTTGDGSGHTHRFHSQTPTHIKQAALPTYLNEWSKNGFEEAMFLGAQVAARLAFCVHNLDAQGSESQRLMYLSRIDYNELGPKGIRTHSLLG